VLKLAKGVWGMSWRQEATKGAEDCDKLGGAVKRALIPRCPNHPTGFDVGYKAVEGIPRTRHLVNQWECNNC
jgi:hypothetical protein